MNTQYTKKAIQDARLEAWELAERTDNVCFQESYYELADKWNTIFKNYSRNVDRVVRKYK